MTLINATYFKGTWEEPFKKDKTTKQTFTSANGTTAKVDMMTQGGQYAVSLASDFTMLRKAFGNNAYSMYFILPKEGKTADEVAASLSGASIQAAIDNMKLLKADIYVPRTEVSNYFDLTESMKSLGINNLFKSNSLPLISTQPFQAIGMSQMTCFSMDEDGATAASVTGILGDGALL